MRTKPNLLQILGLTLVLISAIVLMGSEFLAIRNQKAAHSLAERLQGAIPAVSEGDPQNYSNPAMPVLQLEGEDYSGLIQVPAFGVCLPLGSDWDSRTVSRYPCRFSGSVYDNSLIVGGSKDQFDFCSRIDLGDHVTVTDMTGARFSYEVVRIDRRAHAEATVLQEGNFHLTLFAPDEATGNYIILRCEFASQGIGNNS